MELTKTEKERRTLFYIGCGFLILCFIYALLIYFTSFSLNTFMLPCIFYKLTGFYCPGCGGTRAFNMLIQGNLLRSLMYHPVVIYGAIIYAWYMVSNGIELLSKGKWRIGLRYHQWLVYLGIVILAANFIIKNIIILVWHYPVIS